jgi:hypothetical protein
MTHHFSFSIHQRSLSIAFALLGGLIASGCASTPKAPPTPPVSYEQKLAWVIRLEDQRVLRDPAPAPPARYRLPRPRRPRI